MPRYFIKLSYNGTNYHGWQSQDNAVSIQSTIENAFSTLLKVETPITGAGRTDTGVHAKYYIAHFDSKDSFTKEILNDFCYKLNGILPDDVAIQEIFPVKEDAHARFSAVSRSYEYHILQRKNPFSISSAYYYHGS